MRWQVVGCEGAVGLHLEHSEDAALSGTFHTCSSSVWRVHVLGGSA
jgi:hypothetical protein